MCEFCMSLFRKVILFDLDKCLIWKKMEYLPTGAGGTHSNVLLVIGVVSVLIDICTM